MLGLIAVGEASPVPELMFTSLLQVRPTDRSPSVKRQASVPVVVLGKIGLHPCGADPPIFPRRSFDSRFPARGVGLCPLPLCSAENMRFRADQTGRGAAQMAERKPTEATVAPHKGDIKMGLDQYAFRVDAETGEEGGRMAFQWRKHAKSYRNLWKRRLKTGQGFARPS